MCVGLVPRTEFSQHFIRPHARPQRAVSRRPSAAMATRRRLTRSRLDFEQVAEEAEPTVHQADLELAAGLPPTWSDRLGSLLRPASLGRRWAMCEWFCSPVDAPFMLASEFAAMAAAAGAPEGPLPRARWAEIRRAVGKPRRFSAAFVRTERANMMRAREEETILRVRRHLLVPRLQYVRSHILTHTCGLWLTLVFLLTLLIA